jgi:hypothetical protein
VQPLALSAQEHSSTSALMALTSSQVFVPTCVPRAQLVLLPS